MVADVLPFPSELPVEPRLSKILLSSFDFGCTEEIITVVALLQVQNLWANAKSRWVSSCFLLPRKTRGFYHLLSPD